MTVAAGPSSAADGDTIALAARAARQSGVPLVLVLASSGADVIDGVDALVGWGRAAKELVACSGIVPILAALVGPAVSGPALLLGVADIVVMTPSSYAYVSGPRMVRQMTGAMISSDELGGVSAHQRSTGVAARVVPMEEVDDALADLLAYLPDSNDDEPPRWPTSDPVDRATPDAGAILPAESTAGYDVRSVIRSIVDDDEFLELRELYAPNLVTGFATVDGRPVGIVANQPQQLAGTLDITCSHKGARFVSFCDAFNLPLVTLVDTSGFYPGKDMEWRGMIRHGAQLAFAYARATVPRVGLTLRKSYGGAFIVMDSKAMGCDLHLAWPTRRDRGHGCRGRSGHPPSSHRPRRASGARRRVRGAVPQPLDRRRTGLHRRRHRPRRHATRALRRPRSPVDQARAPRPETPRQPAAVTEEATFGPGGRGRRPAESGS